MSIIKGKTNIVAGFGGTKRCIGEVYFSQSSLATDNPGALPGWTGEYYENGKTLFPDLYNFVKAHSELQVTKTEYYTALTLFGACPKYVVDEVEGSLRLPKYASNKRQLVKKEVIGNDWYALYSDGWLEQGGYFANPQTIGTGAITETFWKPYAAPPTLLFGNMSSRHQASYDSENYPYNVTATGFTHENVQPQGQGTRWYAFGYAAVTPMENIKYPWIVSFTAAVPASTAQAAEFTGALAGKANADLSNCPANYDYVVDSQILSDGSWYRKYKSGWLEQGGKSAVVAPGGNTIVTFSKAFANTTYTVLAQVCGGYTAKAEANAPITAQTETGFTIYSGSYATSTFNWRAEGQGA